jgi:ribosomal protein S4
MPRKKKEEKVESTGPKYLSQGEINQFELANLKLAVRKEQRKYLEMKKKCIQETQAKLQEQLEVQKCLMKMLENDLVQLEQVKNEEIRKHRDWFSSVKKKYDIPDGATFGHDPLSGEIIIN